MPVSAPARDTPAVGAEQQQLRFPGFERPEDGAHAHPAFFAQHFIQSVHRRRGVQAFPPGGFFPLAPPRIRAQRIEPGIGGHPIDPRRNVVAALQQPGPLR